MTNRAEVKSTVDAIAGAAITGSFAIPAAGPAIAACLGGGLMFFDIFYDANDPAPAVLDPADMPATATDLDALEKEVKAAIVNNSLTFEFGTIATMNQNLKDSYNSARATLTATTLNIARETGTLRTVDLTSDTNLVDFMASGNAIDVFLHNASTLADVKMTALPLYLYTVNTKLLLAKICVMDEYSRKMRDNLKAAVDDGSADGATIAPKDESAADAAKAKLAAMTLGQKIDSGDLPQKDLDFANQLLTRDMVDEASQIVSKLKSDMTHITDYLNGFNTMLEGHYEDYADFLDRLTGLQMAVTFTGSTTVTFSTAVLDDKPQMEFATGDMTAFTLRMLEARLVPGLYKANVIDTQADLYDADTRTKLRSIIKVYATARDNAAAFMDTYNTKSDLGYLLPPKTSTIGQ